VQFNDDYCGALNLADTLGASDKLYVYVGADDDSGTAQWNDFRVWGVPDWDSSDKTRLPTPLPTLAPSTPLGPADLVDDFSSFDERIWWVQCSGCTYEDGALQVAGDSMLQRTVGTLSSLSRIGGTLTKQSACNDNGVIVSKNAGTRWNWGATADTARFVWNCGTKILFGQTKSASTECATNRVYTIEIVLGATTITFGDDLCGDLTLTDSLGAADSLALYVFVGGDDDAGAATWNSLSLWGTPSWDPDGSRPPSQPPTALPSARPVHAPTPQPTAPLGDPAFVDRFEAFEPGIWDVQCSGCKYRDNSLMVNGGDMLMRTVGVVGNLRHIEGRLTKDDFCNDHVVAVSMNPALEWSFGSGAGTSRFLWNCGNKYLLGQALATHKACSTWKTYNIAISVSVAELVFADDTCGTLKLADTLLVDSASFGLYIYIGADDDAGAAPWRQVKVWGELSWDPASASRVPSAEPTSEPTAFEGPADLVDDFVAFEPGIWQAACSGCEVKDGALLVSGDSMLQRTVGKLADLAHLRGHLVKASSCDDHFLGVATTSTLAWSWGSTTGAVRFLWK